MINRRVFGIKLVIVLVLTFSISTISAIAKDVFLLPQPGQIGTWEAEKAQILGEWKLIQDTSASGGKYVMPIDASKEAEMDFTVNTLSPVDLSVYPLFGRHSDCSPARYFPYPFERRPGPEVIDWWQTGTKRVLFFTSPENGKVVAFDPDQEKIMNSVKFNGFISDLIVDRKLNRIYVANATEDKVLILNPNDLSLIGEIPINGAP